MRWSRRREPWRRWGNVVVFVSCPGRGKESRECLYNLHTSSSSMLFSSCCHAMVGILPLSLTQGVGGLSSRKKRFMFSWKTIYCLVTLLRPVQSQPGCGGGWDVEDRGGRDCGLLQKPQELEQRSSQEWSLYHKVSWHFPGHFPLKESSKLLLTMDECLESKETTGKTRLRITYKPSTAWCPTWGTWRLIWALRSLIRTSSWRESPWR